MRKPIYFTLLWLAATLAHGQGTFIYDQQSATESQIRGDEQHIQSIQPMGQSFTPTLSSVGFIRLTLWDDTASSGVGATVYLNLWAGSIGGTLLGSSTSVFIPFNSGATANFFFSTPVSVTPGTTYYFQPQLEPGSDNAAVGFYNDYNYTGGTMIVNGVPYNLDGRTDYDLWFREGVYVVPEPSSLWLAFLGGVSLLYARRKHPKRPSARHWT